MKTSTWLRHMSAGFRNSARRREHHDQRAVRLRGAARYLELAAAELEAVPTEDPSHSNELPVIAEEQGLPS